MRSVLITEQAERKLASMAEAGYPSETGGVLIGVRARRSIWITEAVELATDRAPGHYVVPSGATIPAVKKARDELDSRLGYLGEWHSHADDFGPSSTDRAAMRVISWFVPRLPPGGPLLLLVRRTERGLVLDAYRARFPQLLSVGLIATGDLPAG